MPRREMQIGSAAALPKPTATSSSGASESAETAAPVSPTESEMAIVAYQLWLERGCPIGSDQEDWFRAEDLIKNAFAVKRQDMSPRPSPPRYDPFTESRWPSDFISEGQEGHWEVWEGEWPGARWVPDAPASDEISIRARASGKAG